MDEILAEVQQLDVAELRSKLLELGTPVGPIINTTKSLFQKRLARLLFESKHGTLNDQVQLGESAVSSKCLTGSKDELSTNDNRAATPSTSKAGLYYGVCLASDDTAVPGEQLVITDKENLHAVLKRHPGSRFKAFKTTNEAEAFVHQTPSFSVIQKDKSEELLAAEKSNFKAPRMQDLVILRVAIEAGHVDTVRKIVWQNPRYLVSSGDTPTILHEGLHYNALHVAARTNQPLICRLVLRTIADPDFTHLLYSLNPDNTFTSQERISFLLDLYLNMPDKGNCESPLHLASKFGHVQVVQELMEYTTTDTTLRNKFGDTPADVVCSRCPLATVEQKQHILEALEGYCFVELLRSEDNSVPPVIAEPFSPNAPCKSVPEMNSPRDSRLVIKAVAGPMSPSKAWQLHRQWVTPPANSPQSEQQRQANIRRQDLDKGLERIGRELAEQMRVNWIEYWSFLDTFVDLKSPAGLQQLEDYLKRASIVNIVTHLLQLTPHICSIPTVCEPAHCPPDRFSFMPLETQSYHSPMPTQSDLTPLRHRAASFTLGLTPGKPRMEGDLNAMDLATPSPPVLRTPSVTCKSITGPAPWLSASPDSPVGFRRKVLQLPKWNQTQFSYTPLAIEVARFKERSGLADIPVDEDNNHLSKPVTLGSCIDDMQTGDWPREGCSNKGCPQKFNCVCGNTVVERSMSVDSKNEIDGEVENVTTLVQKKLDLENTLKIKTGCSDWRCPKAEPSASQQKCEEKNDQFYSTQSSVSSMDSFDSALTSLCVDFASKLFITPAPRIDGMPDHEVVDSIVLELNIKVPASALCPIPAGRPSSAAVLLGTNITGRSGRFQISCDVCLLKDSFAQEGLVKCVFTHCELVAADNVTLKYLTIQNGIIVTRVAVCVTPSDAHVTLPTFLPAFIFSKKMLEQHPKNFFLLGDRPTKLDLDVFRALPATISRDRHPTIYSWHSAVSCIIREGRKHSFPSPSRIQQVPSSISQNSQTTGSSTSSGFKPRSLLNLLSDHSIEERVT